MTPLLLLGLKLNAFMNPNEVLELSLLKNLRLCSPLVSLSSRFCSCLCRAFSVLLLFSHCLSFTVLLSSPSCTLQSFYISLFFMSVVNLFLMFL